MEVVQVDEPEVGARMQAAFEHVFKEGATQVRFLVTSLEATWSYLLYAYSSIQVVPSVPAYFINVSGGNQQVVSYDTLVQWHARQQ